MERTVPKSATDEIDLYLRTIYSLLRSTTEVQIRTLEEVHAGMNSLLHPDARKATPDTSALIYSSLRLPACITEVEKRAVRESAEQAGAREVYIIEESMAAALGANIPILEPAGHMICDVGGGTTEISVISLGGLVVSNAIRVGGDEFDEAIIKHVRNVHNLIIGESTAENVKITIGNASPDKKIDKMEIKGTDAITGLPRKLEMDSVEVREALQEPINTVLEEIKKTLGQTPPELAADIVERGIVMTGGGSLLKGFPKLIAKETGVPVILAENPLLCVALGAGKFLESMVKEKGSKYFNVKT